MTDDRHALRSVKVGIVGAGRVGATFAYTLLLRGLVGEIVLVDLDRDRARGEAMDLAHAAPLSYPERIRAGTYDDLSGAGIVMIAAGASQKPGESRLDLSKRNTEIFRSIVPQVVKNAPQAILLVATNPVDLLSYVAWKLAGFPSQHIIGSGTVLDTARFRHLLAEHLGVDPRNIHGYIIGEHGDSEVAAWSRTAVAGIPLDEYCTRCGCGFSEDEKHGLFEKTKNAAYEIIAAKGATSYAVAAALGRIVEAILHNQRSILSVSTRVPESEGFGDLYLSLPAVLGSSGVERVLSLPLSKEEHEALKRSASVLREQIEALHL
jgi:L-lactate dehydrogenase